MTAAIRQLAPDVVHGHNVKASVLAAVAARAAARRPRPRLVATFHGVAASELRATAVLLRSVDAVACVSGDLLAALRAAGYPAHRAHLVHNIEFRSEHR